MINDITLYNDKFTVRPTYQEYVAKFSEIDEDIFRKHPWK